MIKTLSIAIVAIGLVFTAYIFGLEVRLLALLALMYVSVWMLLEGCDPSAYIAGILVVVALGGG